MNGRAKLELIRNEVCAKRKYVEEEDRNRVILTCLNDIKNLEELDEIRKTSMFIGDKLQEKIYKIILNTIPDNLKNENLRVKLANKILSTEKPKFKKVLIQNGKFYSNWVIAKDKNLCKNIKELNASDEEEFDIIDSFEVFVEEFRSGKLKHPVFKLKSNPNVIMKSIDDFLKNDDHTFIVVSDLTLYEGINDVVTL